MKLWFPLLFLLCLPTFAQESHIKLPKYPPKYKKTSRDMGVKPGTKVRENGPETAQFQRLYNRPAALRLAVRVPCGRSLPDKDLIDRAKAITSDKGPPTSIDWMGITGDKVSYYAVLYMERTISKVSLKAKNGVYAAASTSRNDESKWSVARLNFPKTGQCVDRKELTNRDMRVAVVNVLNAATLQWFRSRPGT